MRAASYGGETFYVVDDRHRKKVHLLALDGSKTFWAKRKKVRFFNKEYDAPEWWEDKSEWASTAVMDCEFEEAQPWFRDAYLAVGMEVW